MQGNYVDQVSLTEKTENHLAAQMFWESLLLQLKQKNWENPAQFSE